MLSLHKCVSVDENSKANKKTENIYISLCYIRCYEVSSVTKVIDDLFIPRDAFV